MPESSWPAQANALLEELSRSPGRIALIESGPWADACVAKLGDALGLTPVSVGGALTLGETAPSASDVPALIGDAVLLTDLDILFWPEFVMNAIGLLRGLSRVKPRISVWPGVLEGHRALYSQPGRRDRFESILSDAVILAPRQVHFPDEVPYTAERIPA